MTDHVSLVLYFWLSVMAESKLNRGRHDWLHDKDTDGVWDAGVETVNDALQLLL